MTNEEKLYQIFPDGVCPFSKVWLSEEYREPTTKNDLGVDYINKADFVKKLESETIGLQSWQKVLIYQVMDDCHSVTPQPCEDAVSRKDVVKILGRIEQKVFDGEGFDYEESRVMIDELPSVTPQEQQTFKWCTDCKEYDQEKHCCHRWSKVIRNTVEEMKQEYIERDVLDKIRVEIEQNAYPIVHGINNHELGMTLYGILQVIDKYKAESEE